VEELVRDVRTGGEPIALSSIKRLFQTRFRLELSETALGYAKVSELLQDARMSDFARVELRAHGYVLLPVAVATPALAQPAEQPPTWSSLSLADCLKEDESQAQGEPSALHRRAGPIAPLSLDEIEAPAAASGGSAAEPSAPPSAAGPSAMRATPVASGTPARTPLPATPAMMLFPETPSPWSPWAMPAQPLLHGQPLPTLLLGRPRSLTTPRSLRGSRGESLSGPQKGAVVPLASPTALLALDTLQEEEDNFPLPPTHSPRLVAWDKNEEPMFLLPPTPSTLGVMSSVQNTFIDGEWEPEIRGRSRREIV